MESFIEFKITCADAQTAASLVPLFRGLAEKGYDADVAGLFAELDLDSSAIEEVVRLVEYQSDQLVCLETAEATGAELQATFVCGWDAEEMLAALAKVAAAFGASIDRLTAQYDEGIQVCDLVDGVPFLEEFKSFESYQESGFVNPQNVSDPFAALTSRLVQASAEPDELEEENYQQSPEDAAKYADQQLAILAAAQAYFEGTFSGKPLAFEDWFSDEYRAAGTLDWYELPEDLANSNREWADRHGGVQDIELRVKGQIEGLVSIDAKISLQDGHAKVSNTCWIFQGERWKQHNSCAQIWIETQDMSDEKAAALREMEALFTGMMTGKP